jgi:outer membrane protein assembly factor BamA
VDLYRDLGFRSADVQVTPVIGKDGAVAVGFTVSEGPQSIVKAVRIEGAEATRRDGVAQSVMLRPGTPAGDREITETRNRLYGLGTFRSADVRFEPAAGADSLSAGQIPVDAVVSLAEVRKYQLRYGLQLSDENGAVVEDVGSAIGVGADIRDRNFLGRGVALGASGRYEANLQNARGMLFLPRYLRQRLESHVFLTWQKERAKNNDLALDDTEWDATFQQRFRFARGADVSWGYSYNRRDFLLTGPEGSLAPKSVGRLASLQLGLVVDHRDSPFDASRGWFHSQNVQFGVRDLGSDVAYTRYLVRQYVYLPVGPLVLASGVRWGTLGRVTGIPPYSILDLFFDAGGAQTVRGYDQDGLSAISPFGVPLGGTDLVIANQEVRFPIFKWFKGAVFVDAGNTFRGMSAVSWSGLAFGAGAGIRIKTPLAPFRIDVGVPIGAFSDGRVRWYFSVGQMF